MIITGIQAKEADRIAIYERGIPSLNLMEVASSAVSKRIMDSYSTSSSVLILSGAGNNGADGICIGKQLIDAGFAPKVIIVGNIEKASWEFLHQLSEYKKRNGNVMYYHGEGTDLLDLLITDDKPEVIVDAIFGIGLRRPVKGNYKDVIEWTEKIHCHKIAVDVPSGINADDGQLMGCGIHVDETITFGCNKTGLVAKPGSEYAGNVVVVDIGIPQDIYETVSRKRD